MSMLLNPFPVSENNMQGQEQFEVTTTGFVVWIDSAICFGLSFSSCFFCGAVLCLRRYTGGQKGQCFYFLCPGHHSPTAPLSAEHSALEWGSGEQQCWRNRPSRNMQVRKESVCSAGSCPLAQPYHRPAWLGTRLALQVVLSLALQIQSN